MTVTTTPRFELTQWSSGEDEFSREQLTVDFASLGQDAAVFLASSSATPTTAAASNTKAFYWDRTNGVLYFRGDTLGGSPAAWTQVHPVVPTAHIHADLQPLDADLTALAALSTTGHVVRTAGNTFATRSFAVSGSGLTISNADGVGGNPTISINAVSTNTVSTIVLRDSSGNFSAGTITAALSGNASTATVWATSRSLTASGDVSGTVAGINGSENIAITLSLPTGNLTALRDISFTGLMARTASNTYAARSIAVSGTGLSVSNADGVAGNPTIAINSTSAATANTVALRDSSGRIQVASPATSTDVATKGYVDATVSSGGSGVLNEVYTKIEIHNAKLYQYANEAGGTGTALPSSGTRTTPRIYVQNTEPSSAGAITGDIWFQI
jgi:hypothetical protein